MRREKPVESVSGGTGAAEDRAWSSEQSDAIEAAVSKAPSVHNMQPWSLELTGRTAILHQRSDQELVRHDPDGRDRRISCGAAVTNLVVVVRAAGWQEEVQWAEEEHSGVVAAVTGIRPQEPTEQDALLYRAIERRTSYRKRFSPEGLTESDRAGLLGAASSQEVEARWLQGEQDARVLARLLDYAARARHGDLRYQRELAMWTTGSAGEGGSGLRPDALGKTGVPAVGLVSSTTRLPDESRLASWIQAESILVLYTPSDDAHGHFRVGEVAERVWLEAVGADLAASVMTQPLQLGEVRSALVQQLELPGVPHVLMRFGHRGES